VFLRVYRAQTAPGGQLETLPMSKTLRAVVTGAVLAGLSACAAPPPPPQVVAPAAKPPDVKTQLENH
jgi:hypothetical protein